MEILSTPSNKAYGLYPCPVRLLKSARQAISHTLAELMNMSILTGIYHHKLKHAIVTPIYKADDETDPNNYRPISLLSVFNRIFENLMYKRLKSFINRNDIFFTSQYGFRENCSTQHAILDILNKIQNNIDKRIFSCGIANAHLNKIVILQKRVLRLMYFSDYTSHSAPLFACSREFYR